MSGHLHLVGHDVPRNDRHSVHVTVLDLARHGDEVTQVYKAARTAVFELFEAFEARDTDRVIAAERRLLAAGLLAKDSADRLQGGTT